MKRVLFLLLLVSGMACRSSRDLPDPQEDQRWAGLQYSTATSLGRAIDTSFIFVSNRRIVPGALRFAVEERDSDRLHVLLLTRKGTDRWAVNELSNLSEAVKAMPERDWVLYTEGMGKRFTDNIQRALLMTRTYGLNVILYDYPSRNSELGLIKDVQFSLEQAKSAGKGWAVVLSNVDSLRRAGLMGQNKLSLFFHSMGNLTLREALLHGQLRKFPTPPADHLILNAACVPQRGHLPWLNHQKLASRTYVHYNKADYKLNGASLLTGNRKLGSKPKQRVRNAVQYIDFHAAEGRTHNYFLWIPGRANPLHPPVKNYFTHVLHGLTPPDSCFSNTRNKHGDKVIAYLPPGKTR